MADTFYGSCLCKGVQYSIRGQAQMNVLCHCLNCQKSSGSAFQANGFYNKSVRLDLTPLCVLNSTELELGSVSNSPSSAAPVSSPIITTALSMQAAQSSGPSAQSVEVISTRPILQIRWSKMRLLSCLAVWTSLLKRLDPHRASSTSRGVETG